MAGISIYIHSVYEMLQESENLYLWIQFTPRSSQLFLFPALLLQTVVNCNVASASVSVHYV